MTAMKKSAFLVPVACAVAIGVAGPLMGNTALLPQMKVLAASDPAKNVDPSRRRGAEVWVNYPVRETCQTAIDELRIKALTTQR